MKIRCVALAIVGLITSARADQSADAEARLQLKQGMELFEAGKLTEARNHFLRAKELAPDRSNPYRMLGLTEARLGNCSVAAGYLNEFIRRAPKGDARAVDAVAVRDSCRELPPVPPPAPAPAAPPATEGGGRRKLFFGLGGAAAGLALGGVALMVVELLRHDQPTCDDGRPAEQCPFKRDATVGIALGAVGAAVFAGTSAVMFLLGRSSGARPDAPASGAAFWIAPFTDGREVGVGLGGRF